MLRVTNIQRFSVDDGPGIRTTFFLAGCNLRCKWCHNPENFEEVMIAFDEKKCIQCGRCINVCAEKAHYFEDQKHIYNRKKCRKCMQCVKSCQNGALYENAYDISEQEIIKIAMRDKDFYDASDGGVTFSGGEPFLWSDNILEISKELKRNGVNIAVETTLNYDFTDKRDLTNILDLFIVDCKAVSKELHIMCTRIDNEIILQNMKRLMELEKRIWVRIPIVPNININEEEVKLIGEYLRNSNIERVELLPYHKMGVYKYELYGMKYSISNIEPPTEKMMKRYEELLAYDNGKKGTRR